jgi:hypothetical protein
MPKGQSDRKQAKITRTNKFATMQQLDGKDWSKETVPQSLDSIMGFTATSKYKQNTVEEYTEYLNSLNGTDLQTHAQTIGIRPIQELIHLKRNLIAEFTRCNQELVRFAHVEKPQNSQISPEAWEVLSRGR